MIEVVVVKFKKIILSCIFMSLIFLILFLFFTHFDIKDEVILFGETYTPKVKAYNFFSDLSDKVKIKSNIDINKIGRYSVEYKIKYLFLDIKKNTYVDVIDNEAPVINLKGNNPSVSCPNKEYTEEGYVALDNYDGDITDKVVIEKDNGNIYYNVFDSSNNNIKVERRIIYDDEVTPELTLNGNSSMSIYLGNRYVEPGYVALDNCDGDISGNVKAIGNVDTSKIGTYKIKYEIADSSNNMVTAERVVVVRKKLNYYGNGKIYLTFDDGSSYLTNQILDILKEENIKATFFVVSVNSITKRAYDEGHAIALHSNTHNYSYIYSSVDNYFNDLNSISNQVYNLIGLRSKIIRFPGGSSNNICKNYRSGIMTELTGEVLNRGYIYFDWNIDSNDAGSDIYNSNNIYYNVVNNLSHDKTNVVLMHDSAGHEATVNALRNIISYGKTYGYSFDVITADTPVVVHPINN